MEQVSSISISHSKTTLKELGAIERAYEDFGKAKITRTGVMVHYVTQHVDQGTPIIIQEVVINSGDKLEDLQVSYCNLRVATVINEKAEMFIILEKPKE